MKITDKYVAALGEIAELKRKMGLMKFRHERCVSGELAELLSKFHRIRNLVNDPEVTWNELKQYIKECDDKSS